MAWNFKYQVKLFCIVFFSKYYSALIFTTLLRSFIKVIYILRIAAQKTRKSILMCQALNTQRNFGSPIFFLIYFILGSSGNLSSLEIYQHHYHVTVHGCVLFHHLPQSHCYDDKESMLHYMVIYYGHPYLLVFQYSVCFFRPYIFPFCSRSLLQ